MIPGNSSSPLWSMRRKLVRISSLTVREVQPLLRRSWRVDGRAPADISVPSARDGTRATAPATGSLPSIVEESVGNRLASAGSEMIDRERQAENEARGLTGLTLLWHGLLTGKRTRLEGVIRRPLT